MSGKRKREEEKSIKEMEKNIAKVERELGGKRRVVAKIKAKIENVDYKVGLLGDQIEDHGCASGSSQDEGKFFLYLH